ncbi:GSCOCT00004014001.3-RA-CDS, partial [Cotesia congregata]
DQKDLNEGVKIFNWGRRVSKGLGMWPLAPNNYIFVITFFYFTFAMGLEWLDFINSLHDLDKVINNLSDSLAFTHTFVRGLILRFHVKEIRMLINSSMQDFNIGTFKNSTEVKIFLNHIDRGKRVTRYIILFIAITEIIWFLQPLAIPGHFVSDNGTIKYILPYQFHIVYEIDSFKSYVITYILYTPHMFITGFSHSSTECFLITLVYYISGRLVIVAERINWLSKKKNFCEDDLNDIIKEYTRLLKLGETVINSYKSSLFIYMMNSTLLLCIIGYQILIHIMVGPKIKLIHCFVYIFTIYLVITVFCIVSERLIAENQKVCQAFWNCSWYNMPPKYVKKITLCILRSQKPLALKIGKFSYFGISTLTNTTKLAMSYLSVLRRFIITE